MRERGSGRRGKADALPLGFRGRLPLGYQVSLAVGGLLALLAGVILVAVFLAVGLRDAAAQLDDSDLPYAGAVAQAAFDAKTLANHERGFLMTGDRKFLAEFARGVHGVRSDFVAARRAATGAGQRRALANLQAGFERWLTAVRREFAGYQGGRRTNAVAAALGPNRALRKSYEQAFVQARTVAASAIDSGETSIADASGRSVTILLACLLAALVIGLGVAVWVVRTILRPVCALLTIFGDPELKSIG